MEGMGVLLASGSDLLRCEWAATARKRDPAFFSSVGLYSSLVLPCLELLQADWDTKDASQGACSRAVHERDQV